jgi:hypothetical protein
MKAALFAVAVHLLDLAFPKAHLPPTHALVTRADEAAEVVAAEVPEVYGDFSQAEQEKRGRVAIVMGYFEAGWQANPKGSNDMGTACGFGQVHIELFPKGTFPPEMTCTAIRSNLRTSVRAHLIAMRFFETKCGSLRAGLTAYATKGECPSSGWTIPLIIKRCALAGGC